MNNENSKGKLTHSQKTEGCNIDELTVREAKQLGYLLLDNDEKLIYKAGLGLIKIGIKNTNFENTSSKAPEKVKG